MSVSLIEYQENPSSWEGQTQEKESYSFLSCVASVIETFAWHVEMDTVSSFDWLPKRTSLFRLDLFCRP